MVDWVRNVMDSLGYPGIVLLMFLENVFPPIPSELIMPLAGFTSSEGRLSFPGVVAAGTLGSVLGALPPYYVGKWVGQERLESLADRHGRWLGISGKDIARSRRWADRHGGWAVLFCRLIPGVRSLISVPAGVAAMPILPFLAYTTVGAGLWVALLAYAGRVLGDNYDRVGTIVGPAAYVVLGAIAVAALFWVVRRRRQDGVSAAKS